MTDLVDLGVGSDWTFRIDFRTNGTWVVDTDASLLQLEDDGSHSIVLCSFGDQPLSKAEVLTILGNGFPTKRDATVCGVRWRDALALLSVSHKALVDFGESGRWSVTAPTGDIPGAMAGTTTFADSGLVVYVPGRMSSFGYATVSLSASIAPDNAQEMLQYCSGVGADFSASLFAATTFYNSAQMSDQEPIRLVLLATAVESLCRPAALGDEAQVVIDDFKKQLKSAPLDADQRSSIAQRLHDARNQSIGVACADLISRYLYGSYAGVDAPTFFKERYRWRSKFLHSGTSYERNAMVNDNNVLQALVADLIQAIATSCSWGGAAKGVSAAEPPMEGMTGIEPA